MAISKPVFLAVLLICSCSWVAYSEGIPGIETTPCIQELLPCEPFLKNPSSPPATCCVALKKVVATEAQCLCQVFSNQAILRAFNVTKEDAINLAKSCGSNADPSICQTAGAPSGSQASPTPAPSNSTKSPVASPPSKSAASAMHHVGGSVWLAAHILSFVVSAF